MRHVQVFIEIRIATEKDAVVGESELASSPSTVQQSHFVLIGAVGEPCVDPTLLLALHHLAQG